MKPRAQAGTFRVYLRGYVVATPEEWGTALNTDERELPAPPAKDPKLPEHWQLLDSRGILLRNLAQERMLAVGEKIGQAVASVLPAAASLESVTWAPGVPGRFGSHWEIALLASNGLHHVVLEDSLAEAIARGEAEAVIDLRRSLPERLGLRTRRQA